MKPSTASKGFPISSTGFHIRPVLIAIGLVALIGGGIFIMRGELPWLQLTSHEMDSQSPERLFAPHKALYDFHMISADSAAGITSIQGQMFYTQDDACDAWTSEHRFTTQYQYPERRPVNSNSVYTAWEAKDQSSFHFKSQREEDGQLAEDIAGSLTRNPDGTATIAYAKPEGTNFNLPPEYMLPTRQTNEVIRRARKGETFFDAIMFDGSDAEGAVHINTFIGKKLTPEELADLGKDIPAIDRSLLPAEAWHVHMASFPMAESEDNGMTPQYEMDMILHANGVVSHVIIAYKNFKVEQKLQALEPLTAKTCS